MEVESEEGTNNVAHIVIKYELDEIPGDSGFHSPDDREQLVETHQLAVETSEAGVQAPTDEVEFASVPSVPNNPENSEATFQIIPVKQSPDETSCVVNKNEGRPVKEEHFEIVLKQESRENEGGCNEVVEEIILAKQEVIEIDDSSDEEAPNSVVPSGGVLGAPELPNEQAAHGKSSSGTQTGDAEIMFRAFEDAMDDWYSKLSVHGPLKDCEIMESARQLAQHFSFEFPEDEEWLTVFKNRQMLKTQNENRAVKRPQRGGMDDSMENGCKIGRYTDKLSPSIKKGKQLADLSHDAYFMLPSEELTQTPDYPLLLRRAQNAHSSGGRSNDGELYTTKRYPGPRRSKKITEQELHVENLDESSEESLARPTLHPGTENDQPSHEALSQLEALVAEWYFSLTSPHKTMVAPCIFECKAVEIARSRGLDNFKPTRTWTNEFIRRHGIFCTLSGNRSLFLEPEDGLLKYRFNIEFEAWYHVFPEAPDCVIDYYLANRKLDFRLKMKKYLVSVFTWYVDKSCYVPGHEILAKEAELAKTAGLSDDDVEWVRELYRDWCVRHKKLEESIREAYNISLPILVPQVLKNVSLRWAFAYKFNGFTPSQFWMKRYLQLNGLFYKEAETVKWYKLDSTSCGHETFDHIFRVWEGAKGRCTLRLKEILSQMFDEKDKSPSPSRGQPMAAFPEEPLKIVRSFTLWN